MHATRPLVFLLVLAAAAAPPAAGVCVPRKPAGAPGNKPEGHHPAVPVPAAKPKPSPAVPAPAAKPKPAPAAGGDIVRSLCLKTDYPDLCTSSIARQPALPGGRRLDGAGVLRLAMGVVRARAADAKRAAAALAAHPGTQPLARGPLQDCAESYDDIAYSLDHAEKALASGDRGSTTTMLDTVRTDVDTCDQGFEEREELKPLMTKDDAELAKLASNCLAIASAAGLS
jgi:pectinesterase inhibitor-like protein